MTTLRIGTRQSRLALWQTNHIAAQLMAAWPAVACETVPFVTEGDKTQGAGIPLPEVGGKGLFTAELEAALRAGDIDLAVHSLKDLPVANAAGLTLGAITARADAADVLVARAGLTLGSLPQGAIIGTGSRRRAAQLLALRPDLDVRPIRGNVETRIRKVLEDGLFEATILAAAGVARLGLDGVVSERLPLDQMLPAPGQGALAVQCRADDTAALALLEPLDDGATRQAVTAERAFLAGLGGGCSAPVAALGRVVNGRITLQGLVAALDGRQMVRVRGEGNDGWTLGRELAAEAMSQGAAAILEGLA